MSSEPNKIIYSMIKVSKFHNKKQVLKDISLSYFYGAKIGVLGLNGSGKSSLLRILAGVDKEFEGETVISPEFTVGLLEQEPLINDTKTVKEIVEEVMGEENFDSTELDAYLYDGDLEGFLKYDPEAKKKKAKISSNPEIMKEEE